MDFTPPLPSLRTDGDNGIVILDQTCLPHQVYMPRLTTLDEVATAIRTMQVRGAPLIGAAAAFGVAFGLRREADDTTLDAILTFLEHTRPTAVNLHWALARMRARLTPLTPQERAAAAWDEARAICAEDHATCSRIGDHGLPLLQDIATRGHGTVRVMTHCNTGWVATLGAGTALAPVYAAHANNLSVHVWVSETRPRNQGLLTAWELHQVGVSHTLMVDNAAGALLANGTIDIVITGADRIAANGDTANKIGTYLKALAARANGVPFYIAAPLATVDFACPDGGAIPIENRTSDEVREVAGLDATGHSARVQLAPPTTASVNPAFDITPAHLIDGILTEYGLFRPDELGRLRERARGYGDVEVGDRPA